MILGRKLTPLDARDAMGFRGKLNDRSCFFCGTREEYNVDGAGQRQMLKVRSRDRNLSNDKPSNHVFVCANPNCKQG